MGSPRCSSSVEALLPDATLALGRLRRPLHPAPSRAAARHRRSIGGPLGRRSQADASREDAVLRPHPGGSLGTPGSRCSSVEDIHWADAATLDLLRFLGRRIQKERALLLVTFREEESGSLQPPSPSALGELAPSARHPPGRAAAPLLQRAIEQLVGDTGLDAAAVHHLTGGNPYFVAEVVRQRGPRAPGIRP